MVEKYPHSVEAVLQREAKNLVEAVWALHACSEINDYFHKVQINTDLWEMLSDHQRDYFASLLGGAWLIKPITGRLGMWLCVRRVDIYGFHYRTPQRVRPIRVYKNTKSERKFNKCLSSISTTPFPSFCPHPAAMAKTRSSPEIPGLL